MLRIPLAPVRGSDIEVLLGFGVDPSAEHAATGERHGVRTILVQDGQFQVSVERCGADRLPLHKKSLNARAGHSLICIKTHRYQGLAVSENLRAWSS